MGLPEFTWTQTRTGTTSYLDSYDPTDKTPVILLHGGGLDCASLSWRELFPELAQSRRVIVPNLPGYGGSASFLELSNPRSRKVVNRVSRSTLHRESVVGWDFHGGRCGTLDEYQRSGAH